MKKPENWDSVSAAGNYSNPPAGGYVAIIKKVTDVEDKEYLDIEFDIAEGDFKGYATDCLERNGWTPLKFRKYYSQKSLGYFKAFTEKIEATNKGYKWEWEEQSLVGKGFGIVLQEQYYTGKKGTKTKLVPAESVPAFFTAAEIRNGDFKVPVDILPDKSGGTAAASTAFVPEIASDSDELPF